MKAAVRSKYGGPEVLSIKELEIPTTNDNEVLIRVHAASVNRSDCHILTGKPLFMRVFTGLSKPKLSITGTDFAGQIEATGSTVTSFKVGDKVMGFGGVFGIGSHAQYLILPESKARKALVIFRTT
jgi:NADPH:quinone reductase-like Zn-dependent oxidoreductase